MPSYSRRWGDLRSITQVAAAPTCRLTTVLAVDVGPAAKPSAACPAADDRSPLSADAHAPPLSPPAGERPKAVRTQDERSSTPDDAKPVERRGGPAVLLTERRAGKKMAASVSACGIAALCRKSRGGDADASRTASADLPYAGRPPGALRRAPQKQPCHQPLRPSCGKDIGHYDRFTSLRVWIRSVGGPRLFTSLPQGEAG